MKLLRGIPNSSKHSNHTNIFIFYPYLVWAFEWMIACLR